MHARNHRRRCFSGGKEKISDLQKEKVKLNPKRFICYLFLSFLILFPALVSGSEKYSGNAFTKDIFLTESAFITGIGTGEIQEGHYKPVLLIWHLGVDLKRYFPQIKGWKGNISANLEPQFNPLADPNTDFEFGIGFGIQYTLPLTDNLSAYMLGSVGPHYISAVTEDQTNGFVFSDVIGAGLYLFITKKSAFNLGYRLRHISNGGFKSPNGGINNQFGVIGYAVFF